MVGVAQPLAAVEVGSSRLMLPRHHVHTPGQQQGQQAIGAVAAVAQEHVAALKAIEQLAQQGRFAGLLALERPDRQADLNAAVAKESNTTIRKMGKPRPGFCARCCGQSS